MHLSKLLFIYNMEAKYLIKYTIFLAKYLTFVLIIFK